MKEVKVDTAIAAFKLIEILFHLGKINQETYTNIAQHKHLYISQNDKNHV